MSGRDDSARPAARPGASEAPASSRGSLHVGPAAGEGEAYSAPADAYRAGEPGFYVVDAGRLHVHGGPFVRELMARNVRQAIESNAGVGLLEVDQLGGRSNGSSSATANRD